MNREVLLAVGAGAGALVAIGIAYLVIAGAIARRRNSTITQTSVVLHLLAISAAAAGSWLAWLAFASDHPSKWKHLALPFVLVAIVYGYAMWSGISIRSSSHQKPKRP
jgi:hypothetical protein